MVSVRSDKAPKKLLGSTVGRPDGWTRIAVDVPIPLAAPLSATIDEIPGRDTKLVMTAALALFASLPPEVREQLCEWAHGQIFKPNEFSHVEGSSVLLQALFRHGTPQGNGNGEAPRLVRVAHAPVQHQNGTVEERFSTYFITPGQPPARAEPVKPKPSTDGGSKPTRRAV